jgi:hypothetical protein
MRWIGLVSTATSRTETASMPTPAGHQAKKAVTMERTATASDWASRTPLPRSSEPTW